MFFVATLVDALVAKTQLDVLSVCQEPFMYYCDEHLQLYG